LKDDKELKTELAGKLLLSIQADLKDAFKLNRGISDSMPFNPGRNLPLASSLLPDSSFASFFF
jgi:hypothetical protein